MAITFVQANYAESDAQASTIAVSLTGIAAASFVVVSATCTSDYHVNSCADDLSAAGTAANAEQGWAGSVPPHTVRQFYYANYGGGSRTFTVTFSDAAAIHRAVYAVEYAGVMLTSPQDGAGLGGVGGGDPATLGSITPSVDGCLVVGWAYAETSILADSPMADRLTGTHPDGKLYSYMEYIQPTASTFTPTWDTANQWVAVGAIFKPAGTVTPYAPMISNMMRVLE